MAEQQQHYPGHYSGTNKVPTVAKFIQSLDKDKAERDKKIDEDAHNKSNLGGAAVKPHEADQYTVKGTQKKVTDPTTGREVVIEDVSEPIVLLIGFLADLVADQQKGRRHS